MKNVLSLSGGKDSTAMLLLMLERGEDIAAVAYFDTGWDFPEIREHIDKLEAYIGQKIVRLRPRQSFDDMLTRLPYRARKEGLDEVGYGWPASYRRWCTAYKTQALDTFANALTFEHGPLAKCIGLAADEEGRVKRRKSKLKFVTLRYPLVEYGITEQEALSICKKHGFFEGGYTTILLGFPASAAHYRVSRTCESSTSTTRTCGDACRKWTQLFPPHTDTRYLPSKKPCLY